MIALIVWWRLPDWARKWLVFRRELDSYRAEKRQLLERPDIA
jgi:hypothetical protein